MPSLSDREVAARIRGGKIDSLYYFYGHDTASAAAYAKKLMNKIVPKDAQDMNLHIFSGKGLDLGELYDVCEAFPMFCERNCVVINDLDAEGMSKSDTEYLHTILSGLPETTTVIIYITALNIYRTKKRLSDKTSRFAAFCAKHGVSVEFNLKSASELGRVIMQRVEKNGASISKTNAEYIARKTLSDSMMTENETDKLISYAGGGEITRDMIDALCVTQVETDAFKLADAIAKGSAAQSFKILDSLYDDQLEPIAIAGGIASSFIDLYRARLARDTKRTASAAAEDFSYPKNLDFKIKNAYSQSSSYKTDRIRKCLQILSDADEDLKSSRTDSKIILEKAVTRMLMK